MYHGFIMLKTWQKHHLNMVKRALFDAFTGRIEMGSCPEWYD
jgi:hypothetical protein